MKIKCKCGGMGIVKTKCNKCSCIIPEEKVVFKEPIVEEYFEDDKEEEKDNKRETFNLKSEDEEPEE